MTQTTFDPRQVAILHSAMQAFARYGFRKTSMDDIARGAGMSRPALYLHYRNKEDIYRGLMEFYYDHAAHAIADALEGAGSVAERLAAAFAAQGGEAAELMITSPHGREILDAGFALAGDVVAAGEARLAVVYAVWLAHAAETGQVRLTGEPEEIAATITSALKGIKKTVPDYPSYKTRVAQLAALMGAGLTPR
ncbi:MAG: TetR family transcriptional regulator [Pseudodonghicola sp.]